MTQRTQARVRLGFISADHLHFRGLMKASLECPTAEVVGMVVDDAEHREFLSKEFSGVTVYESAAALYEQARPQAIITCRDNRNAAAVVAEAADRGVHVMKEKPMAASLSLADEMLTTANRHGVRLMVNWPTNWAPAFHHAKRLVDEGAIGRVWQVYSRSGHGGPPADYLRRDPIARVGWGWLIDADLNGGGAYIDFCSYGAVTSRWFMGQPSRVMAMGGRYSKDFFTVDDNAILVLGYPKGHSVCEGTWTQPAVPVRIPLMIYGTEGAIAVSGAREVQLARRPQPGDSRGARGADTETIEAPPLPEHYASAPAYFTHCLLEDRPFEGIVSPELGRDAQEILEAGLISMAGGEEVGLPLKSFLQ
jgi:predicted dehydrogenase